MSKLDQLKALGDAKRAARNNTPEVSGTARPEKNNGKIRKPDKEASPQSSILSAQRGTGEPSQSGQNAKANHVGKGVSVGISAKSSVRGVRREGPGSFRVRSSQSKAKTIHDGGSEARQETPNGCQDGIGKVRRAVRELSSEAHDVATCIRRNTVRIADPQDLSAEPSRNSVRTSLQKPEQSNAVAPAPISKRGRPRIGEKREKPWLTANPPMSERTWRRRQAEKRETEQ